MRDYTIDIERCVRCNGSHKNLHFKAFTNTNVKAEHTHWAMCPNCGQPIVMKIKDGYDDEWGT
jgi:hypothetical protein